MRLAILILVASSLVGCGSEHAGTYKGPEAGTQALAPFSYDMTADLLEKDSTLAGTYTSSSGTKGSFSARLSGMNANPMNVASPDRLADVAVSVDPPCDGVLSGSGTINTEALTVTVAGTTLCGDVSATMSLRKQ